MDGSNSASSRWRKPAPLSYGNAIDSVGSVASPLLAGFSLASVIVVAEDADHFRWPGAVALALGIAAVVLIGTVQCAFNARQYLWSASEVSDWWPEMEEDPKREEQLSAEQRLFFDRWKTWANWTRITYAYGIVALLAGLALALPPQHGSGIQNTLRWAACGIVFAACGGEVGWIALGYSGRRSDANRDGRSS